MAVQEIQQINANRNKQNSESFLTQESYDLTQINPLFLSNLSLDDLAKTYVNIQKQSQLLQGMILLEARNKFAGDLEFGKWIHVSFTASPRKRLLTIYDSKEGYLDGLIDRDGTRIV